ncbi:MAG: hypothetical protein M3Q39_06130, partial [Actinomycetota bacterium]|nr:hypothetical protein [Actinomycetota bacterium]
APRGAGPAPSGPRHEARHRARALRARDDRLAVAQDPQAVEGVQGLVVLEQKALGDPPSITST